MKRIIIDHQEIARQGQQLAQQAQNEVDKQVGKYCMLELKNLDLLHDTLYSPMMDKIMVTITSTGNLGLIWIFTAIILLMSSKHNDERSRIGYGILIALLLSIMIGNILIKNIAKRSRPFFHKNYKLLIKQPWDYSFPSGHTLASFAAATVFFYMNPDVGAIALIYAALIALSRLYLRVHFFTDVFFSMILGTGLGMLAMFLYDSHFFGILAR
ncbi:undecaprenyl-diphosphatase [Ruminococcaceae bacterium KH2T8]|nr:undecaprenyl-diphosphatase [Ruminococcaceae bacterium KH2T8]